MEKILITLQELISHQGEDIERLSHELYRQQKEITQLKNEVSALKNELASAKANTSDYGDSEGDASTDNQRPPHY